MQRQETVLKQTEYAKHEVNDLALRKRKELREKEVHTCVLILGFFNENILKFMSYFHFICPVLIFDYNVF